MRCQYDKDDLEYVGLPKLDLLGFKMPTALRKAGEQARRDRPRRWTPTLAPEDKETYRLIHTGKNAEMFQLESPGQMHLYRRLKPRRFSDLVAQKLTGFSKAEGDLLCQAVAKDRGFGP